MYFLSYWNLSDWNATVGKYPVLEPGSNGDSKWSQVLAQSEPFLLHCVAEDVTNDELEQLVSLTNLRGIDLFCCSSVSDQSVEILSRIPSLEIISLSNPEKSNPENKVISASSLSQLAALPNLQALGVTDIVTSDEDLKQLVTLTRLRYLQVSLVNRSGTFSPDWPDILSAFPQLHYISPPEAGGEVLAKLLQYPSIEELELLDAPPSAPEMEILEQARHLKGLGFDSQNLADSDFSRLASLTQLETLIITSCFRQTSETIAATIREMKNLQWLALDCDKASGELMKIIGRFSQLRQLELLETRDLTDTDIASLSNLTQLETLVISLSGVMRNFRGNVTDYGFQNLKKLTALKALDIWGGYHITDEGLGILQFFPRLQILNLNNFGKISNEGLRHAIDSLPLTELYCNGLTGLTPDILNTFEKISTLKELSLIGCRRIRQSDFKSFKQNRPDCKLFFRNDSCLGCLFGLLFLGGAVYFIISWLIHLFR